MGPSRGLLQLFSTLVLLVGSSPSSAGAFWFSGGSSEEVSDIKAGLAAANNCQKPFKELNYYLFDNVKGDDSGKIEPNMKAAFELLNAQKKSYFPNKSLVECLTLFTSLSQIQSHNICNRISYNILLKNDQATGRLLETRLVAPRRIDNVFQQYCTEHANNCLTVYPQTFKYRYKKMNYILLQRVETFINEIMYSTSYDVYKRCDKQTIYDNFIAKPVSIGGPVDAGIAYAAIKILAWDDPDRKYLQRYSDEREGKLVLKEAKVRDLFKKYITEPCQYYVRELGPDVFGPATFDNQLDPIKRSNLDYAELHYFRSWARFKFCNALISRDQEYLVREVVKVAQVAKW